MSELTRNYFDNKYFREELSNKLAQQKAAAANDSNYSFDVLSERTSYTNEKSELHDNVNDQLALRSQIIKNPDFFKQLSLSFYGKKDRSADPSPRNGATNVGAVKGVRTPNSKEQGFGQAMQPRAARIGFKSPLQEKKSVINKNTEKRMIPNDENDSENYNPNCGMPTPGAKGTSGRFDCSGGSEISQKTTPKIFKISKVKVNESKKALFQIPSPVLKREVPNAKTPTTPQAKLVQSLLQRTAISKQTSNASSELSTHAPPTGATTPNYKNSFSQPSGHQTEREKPQPVKTTKVLPSTLQLKIKIPGATESNRNINSRAEPRQSVRTGCTKKLASPLIGTSATPSGVKSPVERFFLTPNRPVTLGSAVNNSGQFRAARMLFNAKETKKPEIKKSEPEQLQEKLFEKYFGQGETRVQSTLRKTKI